MDLKLGLICSLTSEKASFTVDCPEYAIDPSESKRIEKFATINNEKEKSAETSFWGSWKSALLMAVLGFVRAALKGFDDPFGIIFFILGIGWLFFAILGNNKK
jgi:hypothetical protein